MTTATTKPFTTATTAPLSVPYVPPLANTFASTNVSTISMVPNTGKSDAEIVFGGVANLNLNSNASGPTNEQQQQQLPPTLPSQHQHPSNESNAPVAHTQSIEMANVSPEQPIQSNAAAQPQTTMTATNYAQQQQQSIFGTVPPTSIPSLNESFNIPSSTINPSSLPPLPPPQTSSHYQTNPAQGNS